MKSIQHQSGYTFAGLIIILAIIGMIVLSIIKVMPMYMEHMSVTSSLESVKNDPDIKRMIPSDIKKLLFKKLDVNQVTSVKPENVKVTKVTGVINVVVDYEVRKPYFGNIDIVAVFKDEFEVNPI